MERRKRFHPAYVAGGDGALRRARFPANSRDHSPHALQPTIRKSASVNTGWMPAPITANFWGEAGPTIEPTGTARNDLIRVRDLLERMTLMAGLSAAWASARAHGRRS